MDIWRGLEAFLLIQVQRLVIDMKLLVDTSCIVTGRMGQEENVGQLHNTVKILHETYLHSIICY